MVFIPAVTKFNCLQDLCLFVTPYSYEYILNEVIKTPLPLHNHISHESSLMLWMAMWESSLSVQTKWLIAPFCIDTVIIITPAMMEIIKAPLLSWFCGFVLWRPCQLFLVCRQYLLITGDTRWAITPCSEENRVALKRNASIFFFFFLSKCSSESSGNQGESSVKSSEKKSGKNIWGQQ